MCSWRNPRTCPSSWPGRGCRPGSGRGVTRLSRWRHPVPDRPGLDVRLTVLLRPVVRRPPPTTLRARDPPRSRLGRRGAVVTVVLAVPRACPRSRRWPLATERGGVNDGSIGAPWRRVTRWSRPLPRGRLVLPCPPPTPRRTGTSPSLGFRGCGLPRHERRRDGAGLAPVGLRGHVPRGRARRRGARVLRPPSVVSDTPHAAVRVADVGDARRQQLEVGVLVHVGQRPPGL